MSKQLLIVTIVTIGLLSVLQFVQAQQFVFARLDGSPTMNITGWNLIGAANIGDTGGDVNSDADELIICQPVGGTAGAAFYSSPLHLNTCNRWTAEFDFRIWDGSAADGITFCFLSQIPSSQGVGGQIGLPNNPQGLVILLDTYDNGCGTNLELQMWYGSGVGNYTECTPNVVVQNVGLLRQSNYNRMRISYVFGSINVHINNVLYMSGFYNTNYVGYLGFTASTGAQTDRHSVKNVIIYTDQPRAIAGPDTAICAGNPIQIGGPALPNYTYNWSPPSGLSSSTVSNPIVTHVNFGTTPDVYTYVLLTDSASGGCIASDTVIVTVPPAVIVSSLVVNETCATGNDGRVTLGITGGSSPYSYLWSNGATNAIITGLSAGNYDVTVTDAFGCTVAHNATVQFGNASGSPSIWTWNGQHSTDWFYPCNWDKESVPTATSKVVIPGGTTYHCTIQGNAADCETLSIDDGNGGLLVIDNLNGGALEVHQ